MPNTVLSISFFMLLFNTAAIANEQQNYHTCLFDQTNEVRAQQAGQTVALFCASRYFDTAPTAFQAQVLNQDLDKMLQRDPKFKAFYQGIRQHSGNAIYTDQQIILMYIDKREVNKD